MNRILPYILTILTKHPRQKVDIEWSKDILISNIFRMWELLFWRKNGVRPESQSTYEDGKISYEFFTFESLAVHYETRFRAFLKGIKLPKLKFVRVEIPQLAFAGFRQNNQKQFYILAIAETSASFTDDPNAGTNHATFTSATATGSNRLAVLVGRVGGTNANTDTVTSYVFDGQSGTNSRGGSTSMSINVTENMWLYHLVAPNTTASPSVTFTTANSGGGYAHNCKVVQYTGAKQTAQPDNSVSTGPGTVSTQTITLTPVVSNVWVMQCTRSINAMTDSTNTVTRTGTVYLEADSNGAATTGGVSFSMVQTTTLGLTGSLAASFAPFVSTVNSNFLAFM